MAAVELGADQIHAYHEAGHTVAAVVLGRKFHSVSIDHDPGDRSHGRILPTKHKWLLDDFEPGSPYARWEQTAELDLVFLFAGAIAERIVTGGPYHQGHYQDFMNAFDLLNYIEPQEPPEERSGHWDRAQLRAEELMREHQLGVATLAVALVENRSLLPEQIPPILAPVLSSTTWDTICSRADARARVGERAMWFDPMTAFMTNEALPDPDEAAGKA